jgi:hypothetical protein
VVRFHRGLSLTILGMALAFSTGGMLARNKSGEWLLVIATGISLTLLWLDVRDSPEIFGTGADQVAGHETTAQTMSRGDESWSSV